MTNTMTYVEKAHRTVDEANKILNANGARSWVGIQDESLLGCTVAEHHAWLETASEEELVGWAKSVGFDE